MPRMLAIAAALATVVTVAACGTVQPSPDSAPGGGSDPVAEAAGSAQQSQAQPESDETGADETGADATGSTASGSSASESSVSESSASETTVSESSAGETSGGAEDSALRSSTLSITEALDEGEPGLPAHSGASIDDVLRLGAVATWVDAPETLAISLPAGAGCWPSATQPVVESASQLSVEFVAGDCTAFGSARTYTVEVPDGIDAGAALEVQIEGLEHQFTLTLPGR